MKSYLIMAALALCAGTAQADEFSSLSPSNTKTPDLVAGDFPLDHSSASAAVLNTNPETGNLAWLTQDGTNLAAVIDQTGARNRAIISQSGIGSVAYVLQAGTNNLAMIRQH